MAITLDGFALVLGASSGIGAATARALARAGMDIIGVHLDRRATQPLADAVRADVEAAGRAAWFFNVNAADDAKRRAVLADVAERLVARAKGETVRVLMHSIAFGSLRPMVGGDGEETLTRAQIEMTLDVMATSLVYWAQDLLAMGALGEHGRVFAMTSGGSTQALPSYGAVGAAKAALEAYVRQLAVEGAGRGFTANAICAGVTRTPALERIPGHELLVERALAKHPQGRLTTTDDVARCIVALAAPETDWMTGNVIRVDGGEGAAG
ncbi:MAG: Oxidoreductase, short chain dehydrogenase/reductase family [Myxococcaceae bacterium]|nr:Oxidoreductase, short chain dehydrogenase/reductase family [Myxococcaceae bacterium]